MNHCGAMNHKGDVMTIQRSIWRGIATGMSKERELSPNAKARDGEGVRLFDSGYAISKRFNNH